MSGVTFQRITVTGSVVYATMAKCAGFDVDCVDVTIAKSALWPIHWTALRLPEIPNNGLNGGISEVSADVTSVWLSETEDNAEVIWRSTNEGTTFHQTTEPRLVSIDGCGLDLDNARGRVGAVPDGNVGLVLLLERRRSALGECPPASLCGHQWRVLRALVELCGYIDYGDTPSNVYRVDMNNDVALQVGELHCDDTQSPVFFAGGSGLVVCTAEHGSTQSTSLYSTSDGGAVWHKVGSPYVAGREPRGIAAFRANVERVMLG